MGGSESKSVSSTNEDSMIVTVDPMDKPRTYPNEEKIKGLTRLITEESRRRKDAERDEYDIHKDNMLLLKQLYKKMDPTIMKTSTVTSNGEVEISFKYLPNQQLLLIKVLRARDLNAKDLRGKSSDPYVQLQVHPHEEGSGVMQTQVAKKTLNPVYHEIFTVPMVEKQLIHSQLVVQVWDQDVLDKDDLIGEALIGLGKFDFKEKPVHTTWFSLHAETDLEITGDLEIALSYKLPQTLLVKVHSGNNITNKYDDGGAPNPFVKMAIPGIAVVHKTKVKKNTVGPVWDEVFEFEVPREEFGHRYIVFHCVDYDRFSSNESLGQIILDLKDFVPEMGLSGTFKLADLKNSDRLRARWFQHATIQEFREGLIAHAAFRAPNLLFQKHSGTKVMKVLSKKAGSNARLRIMNGIPVY